MTAHRRLSTPTNAEQSHSDTPDIAQGPLETASMIPSASPPTDRSSPSHDNTSSSTFEQHLDIETLLHEEERIRASSPDNDNDDNHTAISSLPPFGEGLRRTSFDFSSIGSSLGNLIDSNIVIDDDSECGPVPSYPASLLGELSTPAKESMDTNYGKIRISTPGSNGRPKEVYINAADEKDNPENLTPGKLSAFMGMSRRHKTSDVSVGGSSVGSNSLSSIFESMGYLKRNKRPHPSRGLTKRRERGALYRFITGSPEPRPASFENEREEFLYRQREARMVNLRAFILMLFLVCILISVIELSSISDENSKTLRKKNDESNIVANSMIDERNQHREYNADGISMHLVKDGVPKEDERPAFAQDNQDVNSEDHKDTILDNHVKPQHKEQASSKVFQTIQNNLSDGGTLIKKSGDIPLLWNIPQSGNDMIRQVFSTCKSFRVAAELDAADASLKNPQLQIIKLGQQQIINVDLSSSTGINRAKDLNLISSNIVDLVITPMFIDSLSLFDGSHRGRAFTIMRDPIERAISLFKHLQGINDPNTSGMNLQSYARSQYVENNWMVRHLTGKVDGELSQDDLESAKDILEQKFIVGLYEQKENSLKRFESYFGITYNEGKQNEIECRDSAVQSWKEKGDGKLKKFKKKNTVQSLEWQNKLDKELYDFAKQLYETQGKFLFKKDNENP